MIRLLLDTTIGGVRFGKGSVIDLDPAIEAELLAERDADRNIDFASAARLPALVVQSYEPAVLTSDGVNDTSFTTLATVIVPAGTMNLNGELIITQDWKYNNTVTKKYPAMSWNGLGVSAPEINNSSVVRSNLRVAIKNLNSLSSQSIFGSTKFGDAWSDVTDSANTANDVTIDHKARWGVLLAAGAETITLLGYSIWYYPGTT